MSLVLIVAQSEPRLPLTVTFSDMVKGWDLNHTIVMFVISAITAMICMIKGKEILQGKNGRKCL